MPASNLLLETNDHLTVVHKCCQAQLFAACYLTEVDNIHLDKADTKIVTLLAVPRQQKLVARIP